MSHARVEELSDSDPDIEDPSAFLPQSDSQVIRPATQASPPSTSRPTTTTTNAPPPPNPTLYRPPPPASQATPQTRDQIKSFQVLYPVYFDSKRTRAQGRRVSCKLATPNPLAWNLLEAAKDVFAGDVLRMAFEPDKTHPKDWANPGRIRIELKDADTHGPLHPRIRSKAHLYIAIAKWLKEHPTGKNDPLALRIPGLPVPDNFGKEEIPVPRGWKMGSILPVHSGAVSGGGVRDDFFKEAMEEIRQAQSQGQLPAGGAGGAMPDMSALQSMMSSMGAMGGLGGLGGMPGLGGAMEADSSGGAKKKKDKKRG